MTSGIVIINTVVDLKACCGGIAINHSIAVAESSIGYRTTIGVEVGNIGVIGGYANRVCLLLIMVRAAKNALLSAIDDLKLAIFALL